MRLLQVLLKKVKISQSRRRLKAPVKLDGYVGVRVKNDKSMVALGR